MAIEKLKINKTQK